MHRRPVQHNNYLLKIPGSGRRWRQALSVLGAAALAMILFVGHKNLPKLLSLYHERQAATVQIAELQTANQHLRRQIQDLRANPKAVEPVAREELGLAARGELIYRFVPPQAAPDSRK